MANDETIELDVALVHETNEAWLITEDGDNNIWVPKSQCELVIGNNGKDGTLTIPVWLAEKKGLV